MAMSGIWRGKQYNSYYNMVYDEKHRRKIFMESVRRSVNHRKALKKRLEIIIISHLFF